MIVFWLLAAAMLLVALAFLLPALLGSGRKDDVERDALNIALYRDQFEELDAEFAEGALSAEQLEAAKRELKRELLDEVDEVPDDGDAAVSHPGRTLPWAIGLVLPLLAIGLYLQLGESHLLTTEGQAELVREEQAAHDLTSVDGMVQQLRARLEQEPDNLEGWQMLGRTLMAMQRYPDAAQAFDQAYRLAGDDPDVMADFAEALAMSSGGQLVGDPRELVDRVLAVQPNNEKGLWLAGIAAYQANDFVTAVGHWERLESIIGAGSSNKALIDDYLGQARAQAGIAMPVAAPSESSVVAAGDATIEVTVDLDPRFAERFAAGDTLYVFARAAQGPRMPLAIVRSATTELPITVTLDDSSAMAPQFRLSGFSEVTVGARLSKSGNATPQPGDLEGRLDGVLVGVDRVVSVTIGSEVGGLAAPQAAPQSVAPPSATAAPSSSEGQAAALDVEVTLDPALSDRVAPGDTLFIYARAANGPRVPLALVRRLAGDLPLTVRLDDSQAMAPNFKLSRYPEVVVSARVSKSGNATPQPGDLQGAVQGVRVGSGGTVRVTIAEAL